MPNVLYPASRGDQPVLKTFAQQTLELQRGKDIHEILTDAFNLHRGKPNIVTQVAADLGTSEPTLRTWCHGLTINIDDYRCPVPNPS